VFFVYLQMILRAFWQLIIEVVKIVVSFNRYIKEKLKLPKKNT